MDHLRWGVVALVVTLHAAVTYSGIALVTFLVRVVQPIGTDVLNMQLCFFPQYIALFIVGVVAYRRNWLDRIPRAFGLVWLRLAVFVGPVLWVGMLVGGQVWSGDFSRIAGGVHWPSGLYCLWETLFSTGVCLGLMVIVRDRWNRHTPWTQFLSDNSFAVYVFHAPILIGLTVALHGLKWPPLAKFSLLSLVGLVVCFALSHLLLRRIPGLRRFL